MGVAAGRRRGPDIVAPVVEAYDPYGVRVGRRGHAQSNGVGTDSFVREWSVRVRRVAMGMTKKEYSAAAVYLDLRPTPPYFFLFRFTDGSSRVERSRSRYDWSECLNEKEAAGPTDTHTDAFASTFTDSPPAADPPPVQPTDAQPVEEVAINPQVSALQAIFPDFEPIVLYVQLRFGFRIVCAADWALSRKTIRSRLGPWQSG